MADMTTAGLPGGDFTGVLPQQYQDQLDQAKMRQALAQAMIGQGLKGPQIQQTGRVAAKISPFAALASVGETGLGALSNQQAVSQQSNVRNQFANDSREDVAKMLAMAPEAQSNYGMTSQFPLTQSVAKTITDRQQKQRDAITTGLFANDQAGLALKVANGSQPVSTLTPDMFTPAVAPTVQQVPTGNKNPDGTPEMENMVVNTGVHGQKSGRISAGTKVTNILPTKEGEMAIGEIGKTLDAKRTQASAANDVLAANSNAIDALESGAHTGGLQDLKQKLAGYAQAFGVNVDSYAPTQQLEMAQGQGILANMAKLRPASDSDYVALKNMVGNIGTDPTALTKAIAYSQAMALRDLQNYNGYVGENQKNLDPKVQSLFSGAGSGYKVPADVIGPDGMKLQTMKFLKGMNGDITQFRDKSGQPYTADASFGPLDPTIGFKGINPTGQPGGSQSTPLDNPVSRTIDAVKNAVVPSGPAQTSQVTAGNGRYVLSPDGKSWIDTQAGK